MEHQSQRLGALRRRSLYRARLGRLAGLGLRPHRSLSAACCDCPHHTSLHPSHHRYRALTRSADHSFVAVLGGAVSGCAVCRAYCNPSRSAITPNRMSLTPKPLLIAYRSKIFPGLRMLWGSRARLSCFMRAKLDSPMAFRRKGFLARPTPCSPVMVPPRCTA